MEMEHQNTLLFGHIPFGALNFIHFFLSLLAPYILFCIQMNIYGRPTSIQRVVGTAYIYDDH